jgi:hypothetical protein
MDPGIRAGGAAHARHAAADHSPVTEPQRGATRRQPVGRSAVERHRRHDGRLARQRYSVLHAARHALRVFQLRVRPAGPHRDEGLRRALRAVHAGRDPVEATDGRIHVRVRGRPGRAPGDRLPPQTGRELCGRTAVAPWRVRRDGRLADHGHGSREVRRLPPLGMAPARR